MLTNKLENYFETFGLKVYDNKTMLTGLSQNNLYLQLCLDLYFHVDHP